MISKHLKSEKFIKVLPKQKLPVAEKNQDWNTIHFDINLANSYLKEGFNIGLIAGDGTIIIDADNEESVKYCQEKLPPTYTEKTCSGGLHYIYKCDNPPKNTVLGRNGGEIRCERMYVVIAPSQAYNKQNKLTDYEIVTDLPLANINHKMVDKMIEHFSNIPLSDYKKIEQKLVGKEVLEIEVLNSLSPYMKELVINSKTKEELKLYGFPSRSERDMRIIIFLLNIGLGEYIQSIFEHYGCGDKYREHRSKLKYIEKSISSAIDYLGIRPKGDMDLEMEIENKPITHIKRHLDKYLLKIYNIKDNKDLFKERLISTLAFRLKLNQHKLQTQMTKLGEASMVRNIESFDDLVDAVLPEQEYYINPLLPKGSIILIGSPPGTGKSLLTQSIFTSLYTTGQFTGYEGDKTPKTLLYALDDGSVSILHSRLHYLVNGVKNNENFDRKQLKKFSYTFEFSINNLENELNYAKNFDIIILDSYRRILTGDENDSEATASLFTKFFIPLKEMGKTIIILHHTNKTSWSGGEEDLKLLNAFRGSGDITAQVDLAYLLDSQEIPTSNVMVSCYGNKMRICKNRLGLNFISPSKKKTNIFCYKVTKNDETRTTTFERIELSDIKGRKQLRQEMILKLLKEKKALTRKEIIEEVKKEYDCGAMLVDIDIKELHEEKLIVRVARGTFVLPENVADDDIVSPFVDKDKRQGKLIEFVKNEKDKTRAEIAKYMTTNFNCSEITVFKDLQELIEKKVLKSKLGVYNIYNNEIIYT